MSEDKYLRPDDLAFCEGHVVEECGELTAAIGKAQRWGYDSYNPDSGCQGLSNIDAIRTELRDVKEAIARYERMLDKRSDA